MKFGIKEVVAAGIGTALFVALTQVQIPLGFIPNTALQPRAALLVFISAVFGPIVGGIVGFLGHALGDAFFYGSVWWSWVVPEAIVGILVGIFANKFAIKEGGMYPISTRTRSKTFHPFKKKALTLPAAKNLITISKVKMPNIIDCINLMV